MSTMRGTWPELIGMGLTAVGLVEALVTRFWGRLVRRRRRILARLTPLRDEAALGAQVGRRCAVEGVLRGGTVSTGFGARVRDIEDAHVDATEVARPAEVHLEVGAQRVQLTGPLQVILGAEESLRTFGFEELHVRSVGEGERVIAEGVLRQVPDTAPSEGGYREQAMRHVLAPEPSKAWPYRPLSLHATRAARTPGSTLGLCLMLVGAVMVFFGQKLDREQGARGPAAASASPGRMACADEIARLLDRNDPWAAARVACADDLARAEVSWMLGEVDEAAARFARAREQEPTRVPTVTEVEATMMVDPRRGAALVRQLKADWYRGPQDPSQTQLDCLATRLDSVADAKPTWSDLCLTPARAGLFYGQTRRSIHHLPGYALHEPDRYVRFQPVGSDDHTHNVGCGSSFVELDRLTGMTCQSNLGATRALFAAVVGDEARAQRELVQIDRLIDVLDAAEMRLRAHPPMPRHDEPGDWRADLDEQRFDVQKIVAVSAAAAWLLRDEPRLARYETRAEAHARAMLNEHLALVAGKLRAPDERHIPSDYSVVDGQMFADIDGLEPAALVQRMRDLRYDAPARLQELLTTRPRHRAAVGAWVREGFSPICRTCGLLPLLEGMFRRREAARLTEQPDLAASLGAVTRKLGDAMVRDASFGPVISLESLLVR